MHIKHVTVPCTISVKWCSTIMHWEFQRFRSFVIQFRFGQYSVDGCLTVMERWYVVVSEKSVMNCVVGMQLYTVLCNRLRLYGKLKFLANNNPISC